VQIGVGNTVIPLTGANVAYSLRAFITAANSGLVFFPYTGSTAGSSTFVAGAQQVETATAAGTITVAGNAAVVVTSTDMAGSPLTLNVAVALNDTAAQWAAKVRAALAANATIAAQFDVSGTSAAIILTRKPSSTLSDGITSIPIRLANDANLNISLNNGTCAGIAPAATSSNTTAGVATSGVFIVDGDGKDFEGVSLPTIATIQGMIAVNNGSNDEILFSSTGETRYTLAPGETSLEVATVGVAIESEFAITASGQSIVTITVIGATA
jgi:hypothetical protein